MRATVQERVARGAALLDEKLPGWADMIDLDDLDLSSGCNCVLGQTWLGDPGPNHNPYDAHTDALFPGDHLGFESAARGFDSYNPMEDPWEPLNAEWRKVILARRGDAS